MEYFKDLNKSILFEPRQFDGASSAYALRALVRAHLDQLDAALRDAQVACRLSPSSSPQVRGALWLCYYNAGKYHLAQYVAQEMVRSHPELYFGYRAYSGTKLVEGRLEEALAMAQKALALLDDRHDHNLLPHLGSVCLEMGQFGKAKECFDRELRDGAPDNPFALAGKAYLMSAWEKELCDGPKAVILAERASRCFNDRHPRYLMLRAIAHAECGQYEDAVRLAKAALKACRPDFDFRQQYEELLRRFENHTPHRWERGCKRFDFFRY